MPDTNAQDADGVITKVSPHSVADTIARLTALVTGPKIMGESRLSGDWCLLCCAGGVWWLGGLDRVEAHGEPQRVGLAHDAAHGAFGVESSEVVAAEIGVVDVVGEHVPDRS